MSLAGIAKENDAIIANGGYRAPSGDAVDLAREFAACFDGTSLYRPDKLSGLLDACPARDATRWDTSVSVVCSKTGEAGRTLAARVEVAPVVLNFASAKNPGGGYVRGAKAQEEDLARCSALYYSQLRQREYYEMNRAETSLLYTDTMIYSPRVPFFRDEKNRLLQKPVLLSVITAPAPNAGEALLRDPNAGPSISSALERRAGMLLALAQAEGHPDIVLGAWGCGVFRNNPESVAAVFADWLESDRFKGVFRNVVFAVYERKPPGATFQAFAERFAYPATSSREPVS